MASSDPTSACSRALGALAVLVLALLVSLALFVGRGGCTSAVVFDRPAASTGSGVDSTGLEDLEGAQSSVSLDDGGPRHGRDAAAEALGPVQGLVVDDVTHEVVPFLEVELLLGERTDRIAVGPDGRFASLGDFPSGRIRAVVHDDGAMVGRAEIDHDAALGTLDWRVEIPIGPTIPFASIDDLPIRAGAWRARIVESALAAEVIGEIDVVGDGLALRAPSAVRPDRVWSWRTLRAGEHPWIRYARREHDPIAEVLPAIELRDDVANRRGSTLLRKALGVHPPVDVDTTPFAKARIHVRREARGEVKAMRAALWDTRDLPLDGGPGAPVFDEGVVDAEGLVEFSDLEGGTKHFVAWSAEERVDHHFVIEEGPSEVVEARARPIDRLARIVVTGWSPQSDRNDDVMYLLANLASAGGRMRALVAWGTRQDVMYDHVFSTVYMSGDGLELCRVHGSYPGPDDELARFRFEVAADARGAEIAFGPKGQLFPPTAWDPKRALAFSGIAPFAWSAWADGMQPVFGDEKSFTSEGRQPRDDEDRRAVRVAFERGYGTQIVLRAGDPADPVAELPQAKPGVRDSVRPRRDRKGEQASVAAAILAAPPVPGVVLLIDGLPAGTSDAGGELRVAQFVKPSALKLIGRGWRATVLEKLPGGGLRYVVWLKRNP